MNCDRFKFRVLNFALGADDAEFRAHLDSCASCRAELGTQRTLLASIDRGVTSMVQEEPSGDFAAHVRRRIAENATAPRSWLVGWQPITAAAGLTLIAIVAVVMIGRPPRPPQSVRESPAAPVVQPEKHREAAPPEVARTEPPGTVATGRPPRSTQSAAIREPEVLVPRGQMDAVMQLYDSVWSGRADGVTLMAQAVPFEEVLKPLKTPELKIPPLEIERLSEESKPTGSSENR